MDSVHNLVSVFTALRGSALWNRNIWVFVVIFALSMAPFMTNLVCIVLY